MFPKIFCLNLKEKYVEKIGERTEITAAFRTPKICYVQTPI